MAAWGRLRVLDGAHEGTVFVLEREVHTLGRGQASDFRLADPTVSRVQAEFRATPEGTRVSGLSDKNPVWVNGEPAGRGRPVAFGDKIQVGLVHLVFEDLPPLPAAGAGGRAATAGLAETSAGVASMENIPAAPPGPKGPSCGRCGAKEAPGARFCGACGAALAGSVPLPVTAVTRVPAPDDQAAIKTLVPPAPPKSTTQSGELHPAPVRTDTMARPPEALEGLDPLTSAHRGPALPAAGTVLKGRFELRRHIAHGRITEVYEGYDRETKASVTVKVLLPSLSADLEVRDWFFHAANAFIVAPHPCLLRVHSLHESGNTCFSVTDFLAGVPLRDQIRSRPPSMGGYDPEEVRRVGTALCEGLARLHEVGPHGDLVPGNVWVDPQGKVTLLDAGLSAVPGKAVRWPPSSDLASAVYCAPEVLRGAPPDARSDLYSVGAILYHMLTADLPAGRIPPVAQARPGLPPDLSSAVDRAMSPRPEARFASAREMLNFLTGEIETRRRTGMKKRYIAAAAAALLLAVGGTSVFWFPPAIAWRRRSFADPDLVARAARVRGDAVAAELALAPLSEFTSAPAIAAARESIRRGEQAEADWFYGKAEEEFSRALEGFRQEGRNAREARDAREAQVRRAEACAAELQHEIEQAGPAGAFLGKSSGEFLRQAAAAAPSAEPGTVLAAVQVLEQRRSLEDAGGRAKALDRKWSEFAEDGEAVRRARRDLQDARALLAEGRAAKAATLARDGILRLRTAMGETMESLLLGLCAEAGIARPAELEEARSALGAAIFSGTKEDSGGAAAAFDRAFSSFAGVVGKALEGVRASALARETALRCAACGAGGACRTCGGTGRSLAACADCAGRGVLDAPCTSCDAAATTDCGGCEAGTVARTCAACSGGKSVPCSTCKGTQPPCGNPQCKSGRVPCLWCKGGVITAAGPDKGKPCTHGCDKGWKPCPRCGGRGIAPCSACSGTGSQTCRECAGKGSKPFPCETCAGKGRIACADCKGTRTKHPDCPKCEEGSVISACPPCAGGKECPDCGGRGRRE